MAGRDVLIVDDDRQVRDVLHQIFLAAGYKCVLAKDGDEGLQVFKAGRPPLVVTDLKMPGITGIELLQQVRAVDDVVADLRMPMVTGGEQVPSAGIELLKQVRQEDPDAAVIVESGAADVRSEIACLKSGAYAYIMKPIIMDELLIAAERALERRQLL